MIKGYVYYTSSARAKNVKLVFTVADGKVIDEILTDENGEFIVKAKYRNDTLVTLKNADGHMAEWHIAAAEFPADLPEYQITLNADNEKRVVPSKPSKQATSQENNNLFSSELISSVIKQELGPLQAQLNQIRADLAEQNEKKRFQDILGALGYLLGLTGIAFYIAARRQKGCK